MQGRFGSLEAAKRVGAASTLPFLRLERGRGNKHVILRARNDFRGAPWFDFVRVAYGDAMYAARLLTLLRVDGKNYAFVEHYVSVVPAQYGMVVGASGLGVKSRAPQGHPPDLSLRHVVGLPLIQLRSVASRYGFIEERMICGGLWVERSSSDDHMLWVLYFGGDVDYRPAAAANASAERV